MDTLEVQRIRGTNDALPAEDARLRDLTDRLRAHVARFGYRGIDTPVLENLDLFLRKSGEEIAARMYTFTHWNRKLCLRPEFTASIMRAYVNHLQERPLPLRLHYAGPTFRYEKPQRGRYRQFTQVGLECIGAAGPAGDAEVLAAACGALEAVGLRRYRLVIGHLGAVLELLRELGIDEHGQNLMLANMENLARRNVTPEDALPRILALMGVGPDADLDDDGQTASLLPSLLAEFGSEGAAHVASDLLGRANLVLEGGSRTPEEIVSRLVAKAGRSDPTSQVQQALNFIGQLHALAGPPDEAIPRLQSLLETHRLDPAPLQEMRETLALLPHYGIGAPDVVVDLSLGRGLRYYTGLVFEIHHQGPSRVGGQIGGGGRYDDLVRALGGRDQVPACGFSFGLERLELALQAEGDCGEGVRPVDVLVVPVSADDRPAATELAMSLRRAALDVELDIRGRGVKANLRHADREAIPFAVILGERERVLGQAVVRDMRTHAERTLPLADVAAALAKDTQMASEARA
ncbi:MAG: histidine--tRNA ligase family protein [Chloroflexi bacterium]|nr:histidine--tRNA ligase family protein [Chloroflexota bacterium]